jgi:hypothetical protein
MKAVAQDAPVVNTGNATRFVRKERPTQRTAYRPGGPLQVAQVRPHLPHRLDHAAGKDG